MKPTLFLLGPSDSEARNPSTREWVEGVGWKVTAKFEGVTPILPYIDEDRTLSANSHRVLVGVEDVDLNLPRLLNVFNLVGDADASRRMLQQVQGIADRLQPHRLFNAPQNVRRTARAALSSTLQAVPGCVLPRTLSADPQSVDELRDACRRLECWPLIVRARGYHGGSKMMLVRDEGELGVLEHEPWVYEGVFIIEYVDCRTSDGLHQKIRVMVIDGVPYARQSIYSDHWLINSGNRANLMDDDASLRQREADFLEQLQRAAQQELRGIFGEIHRRIGLDVFGIDFALADGQLVIFEANACMHFLGRRKTSPAGYQYRDRYKKNVRRALKKMLLNG